MAEQPTGAVTLLFTDIEGSTQLLQRLGPARYAEALELHRRLLREAFERHDGYEVDHEGDAFFVAFGNASDAVAAAAEGQAALASAAWPDEPGIRVRMGVHTGDPLTAPPKYVGLDVHKAARVMSCGHGGQVVLTGETRELLGERFEVLDLGDHRLKDLSGPQRLFQLGHDSFPPLKSLYRSVLPVVSTPFLGRVDELARLRSLLLEGARLVTVTGTGGTGKTRLALQTAADIADAYVDGVFFVPLQALTDDGLVVPAIATTLDVVGDLAGHIGAKRMLVVLDNFEQLLAAAPEVSALLAKCPRLQMLVTSRGPLRVENELQFPLEPLPLDDAVALFLESTRRLGAAVEADDVVRAICERVDGLPLAIELAAARIRMFTPAELVQRLNARLPILTGGRRDAPERQRTLRATIEWSYDLLDEQGRALLDQLAVFVGGARLEAIESVCVSTGNLIDELESLLEKSLLRRRDDPDGASRFWMLETIREYALGRHELSPDASAVAERQARYFLDRSVAAAPQYNVGNDMARGALIAADVANIRSALEWFRRSGSRAEFSRLAVAIWPVWYRRSLVAEAQTMLWEALQEAPDEQCAVVALHGISACALRAGDLEVAEQTAAEAVRRSRSLADQRPLLHALRAHANALAARGDHDAAENAFAESFAIATSLGDVAGAVSALLNRGHSALARGDYRGAIELNDQAAALAQQTGVDTPYERAVRLHNTGYAQLKLGDLDAAEQHVLGGLRITGADFAEGVLYALSTLAAIAAARQDWEQAARLFAAADVLARESGLAFDTVESAERQRLFESIEVSLDPQTLSAALDGGRMQPIEGLVAELLAADGSTG